ncbi:hypothetical protein SDC9_209232 [bioreactor metagenome]|uniref:Uncharacterized protein n=1 Tax=bioreactor metagenome TaxID=1076179 RepID=A0A645JCP9_9ZZZZ
MFAHKDGVLPDISVRPNNQIRRLAKVAEVLGVGPGERFAIVFDVPGRTYVIPHAEPHGNEAQARRALGEHELAQSAS